ncbi:pyrimidine 5-nucleotidase [Panus rudis PR-1116 ss-1]|nr:pyrimidine 5-nucleotidase [Panus rudis PR-1116 ss-1]
MANALLPNVAYGRAVATLFHSITSHTTPGAASRKGIGTHNYYRSPRNYIRRMATSTSQVDPSSPPDDRYIIWLDIDNTLYSASSKISQEMGKRIHAYFVELGFPDDEATELHHKYYTQYGLALRGLVRHHHVDPLDFDRKCDGSLPLEEMIKPDPGLRKLLEDIDRSKARVWALTNAYRNHAYRVLKILKVEDLIEGVVYCDYAEPNFSCKPEQQFFENAMKKAGITDPSKCLFVDDSRTNVNAAYNLGWGSCVHFCEQGMEVVEGGKVKEISNNGVELPPGIKVISRLEELRSVWPYVFKNP